MKDYNIEIESGYCNIDGGVVYLRLMEGDHLIYYCRCVTDAVKILPTIDTLPQNNGDVAVYMSTDTCIWYTEEFVHTIVMTDNHAYIVVKDFEGNIVEEHTYF